MTEFVLVTLKTGYSMICEKDGYILRPVDPDAVAMAVSVFSTDIAKVESGRLTFEVQP